jgi:hypothetical protein
MIVNPKALNPRKELNLRQGIKSSLPNMEFLFASVFTLFKISANSDVSFTEEFKFGGKTKIKLESSLEPLLFTFFQNQISASSITQSDLLESYNKSPLFSAQLEPLQVAIQLFWKLGEISFVNDMATSTERTGGERFKKHFVFSTNLDIIDSILTNETNQVEEETKNLIFNFITGKTLTTNNIYQKLVKVLTVFSEEAQFKIRNHSSNEIFFQQEGIYSEIIAGNTVINKDPIEDVGPFRILKSAVKEKLNHYIESDSSNGFQLVNGISIQELEDYYSRVNSYLNLNPKTTNIEIVNQNDISEFYSSNPKFQLLSKEFIDWFNAQPSPTESYKGMMMVETLMFVDITFFNNQLFNIDSGKIKESIDKISQLVYSKSNDKWVQFCKTGNGVPLAVLGKKNYLIFLDKFFKETENVEKFDNYSSANQIVKIYFGAPGTGKSHRIKEELKAKQIPDERIQRVTFHPEYDYASFIGGFKPISESNEIKYKFVPQVFTDIYVDAWKNEMRDYYLIIEEINRGNCAEIFGDIFQLLDEGYEITPSNELTTYLERELNEKGFKGFRNGKMKLPSNLSILATMNTSDQSLFPMDSAFKRRWDWEYIPINYDSTYIDSNGEEKENPSSKFRIQLSETDTSLTFSWIEFIAKVNIIIKENPNLGMDKCIGNYFIKAKNNVITLEEFINKAVFYLWNDVFKDEDEHIFEENTFYEDFFPIAINGKDKVLKILKKIGLDLPKKED